MTDGFIVNHRDAFDLSQMRVPQRMNVIEPEWEPIDTCPGLPDLPPSNRILEVMNQNLAHDLIMQYMGKDRAAYKAIPSAEQSGAKSGLEFIKAEDRKARALHQLKAKYAAFGFVFEVPRDSVVERF